MVTAMVLPLFIEFQGSKTPHFNAGIQSLKVSPSSVNGVGVGVLTNPVRLRLVS